MNYRQEGLTTHDPAIGELTYALRKEFFTRVLSDKPTQPRQKWKVLLAFITLGLVTIAARPVHHPTQLNRELIVNLTLDAMLEVASDFRLHGQHPTWQQLERAAAKKMNVARNEWWSK